MHGWRTTLIPGALALSAIVGGCRKTSPSASVPETKPAPAALASQLTYTPDGCPYEVSTPNVDEAARSDIGPGTTVPDHVHASFAGDPTSTFAVNWRTPVEQRASFLLVGTDREKVAAAQGATEDVRQQAGHTLVYRSQLDLERTRLHEAHVCGLQPSTLYFYKVGAPGGFSAVYALRTAPATGPTAAFRFGITGDARDSVSVFAQTQKGLRDAGAAFEIFTGDAVPIGVRQAQWNALFEATAPGTSVQEVLASVPFMAANGNHEALAVNYLAQFALPQRPGANDTGHGEDWYAFDYGNTHFVALNDTTADELTLQQETHWLDEHLSRVDRKKTPWLVVYHHRALYSCGSRHGSDVRLRQRWQPLFDKYKVDVVFNGHDHQYERSKPMRGLEADGSGIVVEAARDSLHAGEGTVYLVAAGAGAGLYPLRDDCTHAAAKEQAYHYVVADVSEQAFAVKAYRLDGSVLDQFTITR